MAMTRFEKQFVNRDSKAERNIEKVNQCLEKLDIHNIHQVLELGCGTGAVSAYLTNNYLMKVYGTDFDPEQIEIAKKTFQESYHLHFMVEDASNLNFEVVNFDLVLSQNVFHHIPAWETAMQEVVRVLRPGGYLIWLDLAFPRLVKDILQPFVKNYALYTIDEVKASFTNNGLNQLFYERIAHGPFTHHQFILQKSENEV
jgi:ubiquinone/menaquinone biosynthesis C-methylase UbiE